MYSFFIPWRKNAAQSICLMNVAQRNGNSSVQFFIVPQWELWFAVQYNTQGKTTKTIKTTITTTIQPWIVNTAYINILVRFVIALVDRALSQQQAQFLVLYSNYETRKWQCFMASSETDVAESVGFAELTYLLKKKRHVQRLIILCDSICTPDSIKLTKPRNPFIITATAE